MYRYMCMYIYDIYDNMTIYDKFTFLKRQFNRFNKLSK